jgi:hypothetical protein
MKKPLTPRVVAVVAAKVDNPETPKVVPTRVVAVMGAGVTAPIGPGARQSLPSNKSALRFVTSAVVRAPVAFSRLAVREVNAPPV